MNFVKGADLVDKYSEIKHLRKEITRLKNRLSELDESEEPTSVVCGHDVVLEHLRKLSKQHGLSGLSQLACCDKNHGWYTTNVEPSKIGILLGDSRPVTNFLKLFCHDGVWETLESAYQGEDLQQSDEIVKLLEENQLLSSGKLTSNGFTCYVVLGHLTYNMVKKVDILKQIEISKIVYDATGINYGEPLPYSTEEFLNLVTTHPDYETLIQRQVSTEDLIEYIRQLNVHVN